jgi:hypothetical protein
LVLVAQIPFVTRDSSGSVVVGAKTLHLVFRAGEEVVVAFVTQIASGRVVAGRRGMWWRKVVVIGAQNEGAETVSVSLVRK